MEVNEKTQRLLDQVDKLGSEEIRRMFELFKQYEEEITKSKNEKAMEDYLLRNKERA